MKYKLSDYIGKSVFYFTVEGEHPVKTPHWERQWRFRCVCGKEVISPPARVISGHKKSCGCMRYKDVVRKAPNRENMGRIIPEDFIGKHNNRLTVVGVVRPDKPGRAKLECVCDCGNRTMVYPYQFTSGDIKSCGCARFGHSECHRGNTSRRTHNLTAHRFYKTWNNMMRRCYNPNEPAYRFYGAKGITVCDEWRDSPHAFIRWCEETHPNTPDLSLDRIDTLGIYSPDNCRWITQSEQVHNLRNNRFITINGETRCVSEWCSHFGVSPGGIYFKVNNGFSFEDAFLSHPKVIEALRKDK